MKKAIMILTIIALVIIIIIGLGVIIDWNSPYYEVERDMEAYEGIEDISDLVAMGEIEGSLSYPSEVIPNLEVCAESINTNEEFCTYEQIEERKFDYGFGYLIEVPEGEYYVYARQIEGLGVDMEDYKAYYSEFVECGLDIECLSHDPIVVKVEAGEKVEDIDPQDWYAPF